MYCPAAIRDVPEASEEELTYLDRISQLMMDPDANLDELEALSADLDFQSALDRLEDEDLRRR